MAADGLSDNSRFWQKLSLKARPVNDASWSQSAAPVDEDQRQRWLRPLRKLADRRKALNLSHYFAREFIHAALATGALLKTALIGQASPTPPLPHDD